MYGSLRLRERERERWSGWASSVALFLSNESSTLHAAVIGRQLFGSRDKVARDLAPFPFPLAIMSSSYIFFFSLSLFFTPPSARTLPEPPSGVPGSKCGTRGFFFSLLILRDRPNGRNVFPTYFLMKRERITPSSSLD